MPSRPRLADANVRVLRQDVELLTRLGDAEFRASFGPQIRHCLDFYGSFLRDLASRRVDYDTRERDPLVESSRRIATARYEQIIAQLNDLPSDAGNVPLLVRTEADSLPPDEPEWSRSSVRRELTFLLSHTVHHHALLAEMLRARGRELDGEYGVSPSTLQHRARLACAR